MALFFFFESARANLLVYFSVCTLVLALGPEFFWPSLSPTKDVPVVETSLGKVHGTKLKSRDLDRDIYAYYGIPYAKPPVGELRFRRPEPLELPWENGVHDGSRRAAVCAQPGMVKVAEGGWLAALLGSHRGSEDCLTLNVYVPRTEDGEEEERRRQLPVMVWIHGGGFTVGEANDHMYGPRFLLDRDVILVTIQYRLGALGFLDLGHEQIGGNQALWDQRLALQWVQQHISSFGGDPAAVTVFGESAGSFSVTHHLAASPASASAAGLFAAAIAQSGVPTGPFHALDRGIPMRRLHARFAAAAGCAAADADEAVTDFGRAVADCLRALPVDALVRQQGIFDVCNSVDELSINFPSPWKPVFDGDRPYEGFFDAPPRDTINAGKVLDVPIMIGVTKNEGLLQAGPLMATPEKMQHFQSDWDKCVLANAFGWTPKAGESNVTPAQKKLVEEIEKLYFGGRSGEQVSVESDSSSLERFLTESGFSFSTEAAVRSALKSRSTSDSKPLFYYRFDHVGRSFSMGDVFSERPAGAALMILKKMLGLYETKALGVSHADDLLYLFSQSIGGLTDETDLDVSRKLVDLWANFATFHNPTPKDKDGNFVGNSLRGVLTSEWRPSRLDAATGAAEFAAIGASSDFTPGDSPAERKAWLQRFDFWVEADKAVHSK